MRHRPTPLAVFAVLWLLAATLSLTVAALVIAALWKFITS